MKTISKWADTQTMYTLYGGLKPALQTHVEDAEQREHGHRLMPKPGERVTTFEELKTLATHSARPAAGIEQRTRPIYSINWESQSP